MPVGELSAEKRYILNPRFRLRKESTRVIVYSFEKDVNTLTGTYYMIHPGLAIFIALMDGERTLEQVAEAWDYVMDTCGACDECQTERWCMVEDLLKKEPDLLVEPLGSELEKSTRLSPLDFVINGKDVDLKTPQPRLDFPISLTFQLNIECNRKCIYCYTPSHTKERPHMPVARYIELFDEACSKGIGSIEYSGADPLLNPNVLPLTSALLERGFDPLISTKQHVSSELARSFADIGLPQMQISLDSADLKTAAKMTGCRDYLKIALASIANLIQAGITVRTKTVVTSMNIHGIPELIRVLDESGVDSVLIDSYGRSLFRHSDELFASNEARKACQSAIVAYRAQDTRMKIVGNLEPYSPPSKEGRATTWRERAACSPGRSALTIMTDGSVILCDQVPVIDEFILGSVRDHSIEEVWRSDAIERLVYPSQQDLQDPCRTCDDFLECCIKGGRCLRDVYMAFETSVGGDPKCPHVDIPFRY